MDKPCEFRDTEALIKHLKQKKPHLAKWFDERVGSDEEIVKNSVAGNTFRAFHNMPCKPSEVFRAWASEQLRDKSTIKRFKNLSSQRQYDRWIKKFSEGFRRYWEQKMGAENSIYYGPGRKLPNLLLKRLVLWDQIADRQHKRLIEFLHVPLDKFTLAAIRNCISEFPEESKVIGSIRRNATMRFVDSEEKYTKIQRIIRRIGKQAGVPPIYLDVLAWDMYH